MEPESAIGAAAHIAGAFLAWLVMGFVVAAVAAWEAERNKKGAMEEVSLELGIPLEELDDEKWRARVTDWAVRRSSGELLRNRVSDFCGLVRSVWGWIGTAIELGVFGVAIWLAYSEEPGAALFAWAVIPVALMFGIVSVAFSYACKVLTGRFPGQAKAARQALAQLAQQSTAPARAWDSE